MYEKDKGDTVKKQHHVVPSPDGGWDVKESKREQSIRHFDTKDDAVQFAREESRKDKTELVIHDSEGRIIQSDSHGNDPYPPKG